MAAKFNNSSSMAINNSDGDSLRFYMSDGWNLFVNRVFVWLFPCLIITGGVMNAACFVVTAANRKSFPRNSRIYMLLISGTDAILLLLKGPIYYVDIIATMVRNPWPWYRTVRTLNEPVFRIYYFISYLTMFGAPFFQLGLTVDRAVAVCFPLKAKLIMNKRNQIILLTLVLLLTFSFPVLTVHLISFNSVTGLVMTNDTSYTQFYYQYELYVGRVFLAASLLLGTVLISAMLVRSSRAFGSDDTRRSSKVIRLSVVLIILNVNFIIFSLPWSILSLLENLQLTSGIPRDQLDTLFELFNILLYLSSTLNWIAYFMGQGFRKKFAALFRFKSCRKDTSAAYASRNGTAWPNSSV